MSSILDNGNKLLRELHIIQNTKLYLVIIYHHKIFLLFQMNMEKSLYITVASVWLFLVVYFYSRVIVIGTLIFAIIATLRTYILHFYNDMIGLPKGPLPIPILGNIHQLGVMAHENLRILSKKYGSVMRVLVGDDIIFVVSGADEIIEGLVTKSVDFAGRPFTYTLDLTTGGKGNFILHTNLLSSLYLY